MPWGVGLFLAYALAILAGGVIAALVVGALAVLLLQGLRAPAVTVWLDQP